MRLDSLLVCPACRGTLNWGPDEAICRACAACYTVDDGIALLLGETDSTKQAQAAWFDEEVDAEYEIERPRGTPSFHRWLLEEKFRRSVDAVLPLLPGAVVAVVCAGSGFDAEFLAREGARVIAFDISPGAARRARERARRQGLEIVPVVADAERLPLANESVDLSYVHDGLHHLERPHAGLAEMTRVARRAVSVTEPARAAATALSTWIGYSENVEEAGNRVERLLPQEVENTLRAHGLSVASSGRYAMVYRHVAGRPVRLLSRSGVFPLARLGFRLANVPLGPIGNKLAVQAVRPGRSGRRILVHDFAGHPFQVQLSRELARRGDTVLHLYCPSYPNGRGELERRRDDPPGFAPEPVALRHELRKYSLFGRPLDELGYGRLLRRRIRRFAPEIVLSANAPLLVQSAALASARSVGASFVFWQQDIHGLAMRDIARARLPRLGRLVAPFFPWLERRLVARSDLVVPIGDSFLTPLREWLIPDDRVAVIENWAPVEELPLVERENRWKREHGLAGRSILLYAGTLGLKHDLDVLFELARAVDPRGARVVVVSEGSGATALVSRLAREPLAALTVLPFQPYERLAETLGAADILVALLGRRLGSYAVPSKVLTYLCAGRPLLAAMPAENPAARILVRAEAGIVVEPEDVSGFVAAAERLLDDPGLREAMGRRARAYAEREFGIGVIADRFEHAFELALWSGHAKIREHERDRAKVERVT
ncbi:MAG: methyltransferase domain-containing protein [Gaiellaceae bacterium]